MATRSRNNGLRKVCGCSRRTWAKCAHPWHFNYKPKGGPSYRFSLDAELDRRIESKTEAEAEAERIRTEIRAGTFVRASERAAHATTATPTTGVTLDTFATTYIERVSQVSGKTSWKDDEIRFAKLREHRTIDGRRLGLIVAALETGCRRGELLGLQWADVDLARKELLIRAENAKDEESRRLPITTRLAAVLEMAKTDPAGNEYAADKYVFGQLGARVKSIKKAWATACQAAGLTDITFHDLRHEAGSRLLEAGWPLHHVREMLGHASIETTDRYLNAGRMALHDSMRRVEAARCNPVASEAGKEQRPVSNDEEGETVNRPVH